MTAIVTFRNLQGEEIVRSVVGDGRKLGYSIPDGASHVTVEHIKPFPVDDDEDTVEDLVEHHVARWAESLIERIEHARRESATAIGSMSAQLTAVVPLDVARQQADLEYRLANCERLLGVRLFR